MPRLLAIVIASWFMSSLAAADPATTPVSTNAAVDEVRQSFTLDGKPIPPGIFRDLGDGDMADSISILVSVDLKAAVGSNRYSEDISKSGPWLVQRKRTKSLSMAGKLPVTILSDRPPTTCLLPSPATMAVVQVHSHYAAYSRPRGGESLRFRWEGLRPPQPDDCGGSAFGR